MVKKFLNKQIQRFLKLMIGSRLHLNPNGFAFFSLQGVFLLSSSKQVWD